MICLGFMGKEEDRCKFWRCGARHRQRGYGRGACGRQVSGSRWVLVCRQHMSPTLMRPQEFFSRGGTYLGRDRPSERAQNFRRWCLPGLGCIIEPGADLRRRHSVGFYRQPRESRYL